jgi:arylsulfatase A-like enzyme
VGLTGAAAPWNAPRQYFEMYRVEDMRLGDVDETDLEDVAPLGRHFAKKVYRESGEDWTFSEILRQGKWELAARNYLACISHVDAQVGRLAAAWKASEAGKDGVVILLSDHGWHLGEKLHWGAGTLWETATRVPLVIAAPGLAKEGGVCQRPVSLVDIYPTLVEVCGLGRVEGLEGESLGHFLKKPGGKRAKPAVMSWGKGSFALRSEQWRVIKYADGGVELYDIWSDPREKTNLALGPRHRSVVADELRWAPEIHAETAGKRS